MKLKDNLYFEFINAVMHTISFKPLPFIQYYTLIKVITKAFASFIFITLVKKK